MRTIAEYAEMRRRREAREAEQRRAAEERFGLAAGRTYRVGLAIEGRTGARRTEPKVIRRTEVGMRYSGRSRFGELEFYVPRTSAKGEKYEISRYVYWDEIQWAADEETGEERR